MKKRGFFYLIIVILLILSFLVSLIFDSEIVVGISEIRNCVLDNFFLGLTAVSSGIIIFFILPSLFLWKENKREWILPLWFTLFLSTILSFTLKILMKRKRPFQLNIVETLHLLGDNSLIWNCSFPSFHAMFAFCAIPILSKEFPKFRYIWIAFAILIAFSRIYFGMHFLSDVIFGGAIGYLIGSLIVKFEKENKFWKKLYSKCLKKNHR